MASIALIDRVTVSGRVVPRALHPLAWWLWAMGLAVACSRTTNPLILASIVAAAAWVVMARRGDGPWAHAFRLYLIAASVVVASRVAFRILFGGGGVAAGDQVLVRLPGVSLPSFVAGIHLLGPLTAESLLGGLYDGMRLGAMLVCVGAANALANPRRLLRCLPPALSEVATAVVVALSVLPQLAEAAVRVRSSRRLRPSPARGIASLRAIVIPVLEDTLDRSIELAASMESRGYGRRAGRSRSVTVLTGFCMVCGLLGVCVGVDASLDATMPRLLGGPLLVLGAAVGAIGIGLSGIGVARTSYRPDRWRSGELLVVAAGLGAATLILLSGHVSAAALVTPVSAAWPRFSPLAVSGVLVGLLPAFLTPPAPSSGGSR